MHGSLSFCFLTTVLAPLAQEVKVTAGPEPAYTDPADFTQVAYDVRDLVDRTSPLWESPTEAARAAEEAVSGNGERLSVELGYETDLGQKKQRRANLRELARVLMAFEPTGFVSAIPLGSWKLARVEPRIDCIGDGELDVTAWPEQHAFVREFLALQRTSTDSIRVSFLLVTGGRDSFAKLRLPISGVLAEGEQVKVLGQIKGGAFDLLTSPTLSVRPLQRGDLSAVNEFSYVKEYHTQIVQPSGGLISDPVIEVIHEGVFCSVRSVALPGGTFGLSVDVQNVEVLRPVRTKTVRIAAGVQAEGEIMLPEILRARLSGDVRLADGATAIFVTPLTEEKDMALFVTLERESTEK